MIARFFAKLSLGAVDLKGWAWLGVAIAGLAFAVWLCTTLYLAGIHAERVTILEATIEQIKADLAANEEIRKEAEADAAVAEAEVEKQKELLDELRKAPRSCALTPEHVDGVHRIDQGR